MPAPLPAAEALAALRAAGHVVTQTTRHDAALRYGCPRLIYVVNGRGVNLGRLRQLAAETLAAETLAAQAEPIAPEAAPVVVAEPEAVARLGFARPAPKGEGLEGQPWDPGTPAARAMVALQGERVGILWPLRRALAGAGVALPASWATDGPVMGGELTLTDALARLPLGATAQAAAALAALPPVTVAQDAALALCRTGAVPGRPYL